MNLYLYVYTGKYTHARKPYTMSTHVQVAGLPGHETGKGFETKGAPANKVAACHDPGCKAL